MAGFRRILAAYCPPQTAQVPDDRMPRREIPPQHDRIQSPQLPTGREVVRNRNTCFNICASKCFGRLGRSKWLQRGRNLGELPETVNTFPTPRTTGISGLTTLVTLGLRRVWRFRFENPADKYSSEFHPVSDSQQYPWMGQNLCSRKKSVSFPPRSRWLCGLPSFTRTVG